jgi:hypothetical protein
LRAVGAGGERVGFGGVVAAQDEVHAGALGLDGGFEGGVRGRLEGFRVAVEG